jgi:predicted DCC family thiol-disulfide oxidoreductase YuxK
MTASDAVRSESEADRRQAPGPDGLMVFDGFCNFCSAQVQLLLRLDREGVIRFTAIQSPYGRHLAERFGLDPDDPSTFLFFENGRPLQASDAAIAVARRLGRPWRWLRGASALPRPMRDGIYRFVARNRYRIAGRRQSCMAPSPQMRARFIDEVPPGER